MMLYEEPQETDIIERSEEKFIGACEETYHSDRIEEKVGDTREGIDVMSKHSNDNSKEIAITDISRRKKGKVSEEPDIAAELPLDVQKIKDEIENSNNVMHHLASDTLLSLSENMIVSGNKDRPFKCRKCNKTFRYELHCKSHIKVHELAKKFTCPVCSLSFPYDCKLKKHMVRHFATKTHTCRVCMKSFLHTKGLIKHMRSHSSKKQGTSEEISKVKVSVKGICRQKDALQRSKVDLDKINTNLLLLHNVESPKTSDCNINDESKLCFDVMRQDSKNIKREDYSLTKDQLKLEMEMNNESTDLHEMCYSMENGEWTLRKKLSSKREKQVENVSLKKKYKKVEVSRDYCGKEVRCKQPNMQPVYSKPRKQHKERCRVTHREPGNIKKEFHRNSLIFQDEKVEPHLDLISELIIVDEIVTDDIYENASDPLA